VTEPIQKSWRDRSAVTMSSTVRTELLTILVDLSAACPEMRFGQLIANLSTLAKGLSAESLWDVEDDELVDAARQQLAYFAEHRVTRTLEGGSLVADAVEPSA